MTLSICTLYELLSEIYIRAESLYPNSKPHKFITTSGSGVISVNLTLHFFNLSVLILYDCERVLLFFLFFE